MRPPSEPPTTTARRCGGATYVTGAALWCSMYPSRRERSLAAAMTTGINLVELCSLDTRPGAGDAQGGGHPTGLVAYRSSNAVKALRVLLEVERVPRTRTASSSASNRSSDVIGALCRPASVALRTLATCSGSAQAISTLPMLVAWHGARPPTERHADVRRAVHLVHVHGLKAGEDREVAGLAGGL